MTGLVGQAFAQTSPELEPTAPQNTGAAAATAASAGSLTPVYIGAAVVGVAVIAAASTGGGDKHGTGGTTGTTGTTGTH